MFKINNLRNHKRGLMLALGACLILLLAGCAPSAVDVSGPAKVLHPDEDDKLGGTFLESGDVRTIAQQMAAAILSTPEISQSVPPVYIALSPVKNNTRFIVDRNIFMKRLRIELNRVSGGQIRFFDQDNATRVRGQIWRERREGKWQDAIKKVAVDLLNKMPGARSGRTYRIAVGKIKATNVEGLNADSFLALLRAEIAKIGRGKVVFVSKQVSGKIVSHYDSKKTAKGLGADYLLTGEFIGEGIHSVKGEDKYLVTAYGKQIDRDRFSRQDTFMSAKLELRIRKNPNANLWFNANLVNLANDTVSESMTSLKDIMVSGVGKAKYILAGELSALSKTQAGARKSDYIIMSFQLINPDTNVILWEDAYESKRSSKIGTVYQ